MSRTKKKTTTTKTTTKKLPVRKAAPPKPIEARATRRTLEAFKDEDLKKVTPGASQSKFLAHHRASSKPRAEVAPFPIVAVGASAGGIESFTEFLKNIPLDTGMAYVYIQHLAPQRESLLPEILGRVTKMPVFQAENDMVVQPNCVYVIPPNVDLGIVHGVLKLMPRVPAPVRHMPVDFFLRCLADDQSRFAIAVILSGADGDGAMGLRAIREQGGLTFVQDPGTATVNGMPNSAIAAGAFDRVLPIAGIAAEIVSIARQPLARVSHSALGDDDKDLRELFRRLQRSFGVNFAKYKRTTIERRLRRRMLLHKVGTLAEYLETLTITLDELNQLYRDFLIGTTAFFRDPEVFEIFKRDVLPGLLEARTEEDPLRLWIAGCSTGEEVYSVAICVLEVQTALGLRCPIQIFASDLNEDALKKAREGFYPESIVTDVSELRLSQFFTRSSGGYRVISRLRDLCIFTRHNVTSDPPFSRMHGIFCRNLLIYFDSSFQRNVVKLFNYALNSGGCLVLGSAEIPGASDYLEAIDGRRRIYRRTTTGTRSHFDVQLTPKFPIVGNAHPTHRALESGYSSLDRLVDRILIERFAPAGVLINANMQIVQFRGGTSDFLEGAPGDASFNLFKMAKPGLDAELRVLIKKVESSGLPRRNDNVVLRDGRSRKQVVIEVIPVRASGEPPHYLVLFSRPVGKAKERVALTRSAKTTSEKRLERELTSIKEHLQSIIREQEYSNTELQTANEEVLSSNEELQSTNEELQTAKEELQSTNEELSTVNEELLDRNAQLQNYTNDLTNLLASVNLPIVMVDQKFNIRRFTPGAERLFNIIESDIGRPISQLRPNLDVPDFNSLIRASIESARTTELEVRDRAGHWYSLRIRPYLTAENRIEGAVIMLIDIGAIKIASEQLRESRGVNDTFFDTISQPVLILDAELSVLRMNDGFARTFNVSSEGVVGKRLFTLGDGAWNVPMLKALLSEILPKSQQVTDYHLKQTFPEVGRKELILNGRSIQIDGASRILLIIDDVTRVTQG